MSSLVHADRGTAVREPGPIRFIRRHPLAAFFIWSFTVGQAFAFAPLFLAAAGVSVVPQFFILGATLVGLLLPALAITGIVSGRAAVRDMLRRALPARAGIGWYLLALVAIPFLSLVITWATADPSRVNPSDVLGTVLTVFGLQLVLALVPNNLAEEVAWTGFVQNRFTQRHGAVLAALIVAPLFALQHVSLAVPAGAAGIILLVILAVLSVPFRLITGWVYNRTASLFLVGLVHASANAAAAGSGFGEGWARVLWPDNMLAGLSHHLAFVVLVVPVLIFAGRRLGISRREAKAARASR